MSESLDDSLPGVLGKKVQDKQARSAFNRQTLHYGIGWGQISNERREKKEE